MNPAKGVQLKSELFSGGERTDIRHVDTTRYSLSCLAEFVEYDLKSPAR